MATFAQRNGGNSLPGQSQLEPSEYTGQVTPEISRLLDVLKGEMSRQQLQTALGLNSRDNFDKRYLKSAIELKLVESTIPNKPSSRLQKYLLTPAGQIQLLNLKAQHK